MIRVNLKTDRVALDFQRYLHENARRSCGKGDFRYPLPRSEKIAAFAEDFESFFRFVKLVSAARKRIFGFGRQGEYIIGGLRNRDLLPDFPFITGKPDFGAALRKGRAAETYIIKSSVPPRISGQVCFQQFGGINLGVEIAEDLVLRDFRNRDFEKGIAAFVEFNISALHRQNRHIPASCPESCCAKQNSKFCLLQVPQNRRRLQFPPVNRQR